MLRRIWLIWLAMFIIIILADVPKWLTEPNWVEFTTLGAAVLLGIITIGRWFYYRKPFTMKFSLQPFEAQEPDVRQTRRNWQLPLGYGEVLVMLTSRKMMNVREIDVRFQQRRWKLSFPPWRWQTVSEPDALAISALVDLPYFANRFPPYYYEHERGYAPGSYIGLYFHSQISGSGNIVPAHGVMWLGVTLQAGQYWKGRLSIEIVSDQRRDFIRRGICISRQPTLDMAEFRFQSVLAACPETTKDYPDC